MTILDAPDNTTNTTANLEQDWRTVLLYAVAKMFDRAAYYGIRSIFVLSLVLGSFEMERTEALALYGSFAGAALASEILGAIFGDLLLGNRKTILIGGALQALGALCLCGSEMYNVYVGGCLIAVGSGLFTPNIVANFGRSYLRKIHLLDAGFSIFYLAINLGSFFGVLFLGYMGGVYGWSYGFGLAAVFSLLSILPVFYLKEQTLEEAKKYSFPSSGKFVKIILVVLVNALFWGVYSLIGLPMDTIKFDLVEGSSQEILFSNWSNHSLIFSSIIAIVCSIIWSHFHSTRFFKLTVSFLLMALSIGILFFILEIMQDEIIIYFAIATIVLSAAEIYIAPVLLSMITEYANPKYLATTYAFATLPAKMIGTVIFSLVAPGLLETPLQNLSVGLSIALLCAVSTAIVFLLNKLKKNKDLSRL